MPHDTQLSILGQRDHHPQPNAQQHPLRAGSPCAPPASGTNLARAFYLHVPFCFHKCHYCDFYSIVDSRDRQEAFTARLVEEIRALAPYAGPLRTVFVGGGTPTLLKPDLWQILLVALHECYELAELAEFTVECNPETASSELMDVLRAGGVDRLSIGAQSFHPGHLKTLERWHDPANVSKAIQLARAAGIERLSLDLIHSIPGQTPEHWRDDLDTALALQPEHLSCYALTYEPGTAMTVRLDRGEIDPVEDELALEFDRITEARLTRAGLERYEVSNYALPGARSEHNLAYWRNDDYLAAGPSASGHLAGWRWRNVPRLDTYLRRSDAGLPPAVDVEPPDPRRELGDTIMMGLRMTEGISRGAIADQAGSIDPALAERLDSECGALRAEGLIRTNPDRLALTPHGRAWTNRVVLRFLDALSEPSPEPT